MSAAPSPSRPLGILPVLVALTARVQSRRLIPTLVSGQPFAKGIAITRRMRTPPGFGLRQPSAALTAGVRTTPRESLLKVFDRLIV